MNDSYSDLRDIRSDLEARLRAVRSERMKLTQQLRDLEVHEAAFTRALEAEVKRLGGASTAPAAPKPQLTLTPGPVGPTEFVLEALADGKSRSLEMLKEMAATVGLEAPDKQPLGRVIHGALLSLKQSGRVQMIERGVWRLAPSSS